MASKAVACQAGYTIKYAYGLTLSYPLPSKILNAFHAFGKSNGIRGSMWQRNRQPGLSCYLYTQCMPPGSSALMQSKWNGGDRTSNATVVGEKQKQNQKDKLFLQSGVISSPQNIQVRYRIQGCQVPCAN